MKMFSVLTIEKGEGVCVDHALKSFFSESSAKKYFAKEKARIISTYSWIENAKDSPEDWEYANVEDQEDSGYFYASYISDDGWDRYVEVCMHEESLCNALIIFEWETGDASSITYPVSRVIRLDENNIQYGLNTIEDAFVNHAEDLDEDLSYEEMTDEILDSLDLDFKPMASGEKIDICHTFRI